MEIQYRNADLQDLQEIYSLVQTAIDAMINQNILQWDEQYPTRDILSEDIKKNQLYVGMIENRIAVIYVLNQECNEEYINGAWKYKNQPSYVIHRLCVNPDLQNNGIGRTTMLQIEKQLLEKGIKAIRLDVYSQNPSALKLYDSMGYTKVGDADLRKGRFYLMEKYL